jgi:putative PIN family toxin of toxin-antitoxin system
MGFDVADSYESPPIVMDTNVLVAGACRRESSLAYQLLLGVLEEKFPLILTESIALEYLDVLERPAVRRLTGLSHRESEELVTDLIALSRQVQLGFSWRPNLRDERDNKFVEAAIHSAAVIVTYNVSDYRSAELGQYGWTVMTPQEFLARYA